MSNKYYRERKEKRIENEIKDYIKSCGGLCYKIHGGDPYQESGIPDLLCCWGGLFFGIEVKDPGGKPSAIQLAQGIRIKKAKGHFIIATSVKDIKNYIYEKGLWGELLCEEQDRQT